MARNIIITLLTLLVSFLYAQTTLFIEDFENGASDWVFLNHNVAPNGWYHGTATANSGSHAIYVSNTNGSTYTYQGTTVNNIAANSRVHVYRQVSIPSNVTHINVNLDIRCTGESGYDYVRVYYMPTNVTPEASTSNYTTSVTDPYGQYRVGLDRYNSFTLTNPINAWNNVNIPIPDRWAGQTGRLVFTWLCDSSQAHQPPGAIDNVKLTYQYEIDTPPPVFLLAPLHEATFIPIDTSLSWTPNPNGHQPTSYTIYIGTTDPPHNFEIVTDDQTTCTPTTPLNYSTTYFWQIVPSNQYGATPQDNCDVWSFTTIDEHIVTVGTGSSLSRNLPINMNYGYSYSQTIYYQEELADIPLGSYINQITYQYINTVNTNLDEMINVYLYHTVQNDFSSNTSWIPLSNFTLVYSGEITARAPEDYAVILFNEDIFIYQGGNIVVAVTELTSGVKPGHNNSNWLHTAYPDHYRSIYYYHDTNPPNVNNPQPGTRIAFAPNTLFSFIPSSSNNLIFSPASIEIGDIVYSDYVDRIILFKNFGASAITISNISTTLGISTNKALPFTIENNDQEAIDFLVEANTNTGPFTGTITVTSDADNGPLHFIDVTANIIPQNMVLVSGGTDLAVNSVPIYPYYRYSYSQSIYLPSELNMQTGDAITRIQYQYNGYQNYPQDVTLYMGLTDVEQFYTGTEHYFIPHGELTLVYDHVFYLGNQIDHDTGEHWIEIYLDTEFRYDSTKNLVIALLDNQPGIVGSSSSAFYHKPTTGYRSIRIFNDDSRLYPLNLVTGSSITSVPNIRIFYDRSNSHNEDVNPPKTSKLLTNYPNPFNPSTNIAFELDKTTPVTLEVYNIKGQRVKTFPSNVYTSGKHTITWNGTDDSGHPVTSGVYFYRMQTDEYIGVRKMLLLK